MDHQREARRYTDQIEEENFRQRKLTESIQREKEVKPQHDVQDVTQFDL